MQVHKNLMLQVHQEKINKLLRSTYYFHYTMGQGFQKKMLFRLLHMKTLLESSPKVNDVHDLEDVADKEGQHQMLDAEQALRKEEITSTKKAAQTTSTNKLSTVRPFVSTANTNTINAASTPTGENVGESSFVYLGGKIPIDASTLPNADLPIDPNMPDLEDDSDVFPKEGIFSRAYDDEDVGAVADFNNMDNTINVSLIPTLRVYKDHPKGQILEDPKSAV
ncbi:hypothetical protein Tco_0411931 [Tanacetum coccineum]